MTSHKQIEELEDVVQENKRATRALQECLRTKLKEYEDVVQEEFLEMDITLSETPVESGS
jgi:hypothetical protein